MKISARYRKMAGLYRFFAREFGFLDFSDAALASMHAHESRGAPVDRLGNGFYVGKKWLNLAVSSWREDIAAGLIAREELYADPNLPSCWLDRVLGCPSSGRTV